jgi:hypothetical protein
MGPPRERPPIRKRISRLDVAIYVIAIAAVVAVFLFTAFFAGVFS